MNKVIFTGRISKDIKSEQTTNGIDYCRFAIAVQRRQKNQQGEYITDFFECVAWRECSKFISKYFKKGSKVILFGEMQTRSYEVESGKRYVTELVVHECDFADSKTNVVADHVPEETTPIDDDLPF